MHTPSRGFTLIELVIVIVLLGILSAVALPRFLDLSTDARRSVNQGVVGSLNSAVNTFSARSQLPPDSMTPQRLQGKAVDMTPTAERGTYVYFDSNGAPIGGGTNAPRYSSGECKIQAKDKVTGEPAVDKNGKPVMEDLNAPQGISPQAICGPAEDDAMLNRESSAIVVKQACANIFNGLLSDNSVRAGVVDGEEPANAARYAYQVESAETNHCVYINTSSIGTRPQFRIEYDADKGQFTAGEAGNGEILPPPTTPPPTTTPTSDTESGNGGDTEAVVGKPDLETKPGGGIDEIVKDPRVGTGSDNGSNDIVEEEKIDTIPDKEAGSGDSDVEQEKPANEVTR